MGSDLALRRPATGAEYGWTDGYADVGGVRLHYVEAGSGPLVVLLHGFPQLWLCWRHQIGPLAAAGFRAVALDMRGYNLSDKPRGVRHYTLDRLAADVEGLIAALGHRSADVVAHDWGGIVAWHLAATRPACVRRLVVLNAPHPGAYWRELRTLDQLRRSWYVFVFQLPWLPEAMLRRRDFAVVERILRTQPARAGAFDDDDVRAHKAALAQPGALTAMVNYYRATLRRLPGLAGARERRVEAPTLLIWGEADRYLRPQLADGLERWVPRLRVERLPGVSHWVMADAPEAVTRLLLEALGAAPAQAAAG
ncbi:MAG TPA: alpha/beta fold hydrolase [Gemmatimonadaceae bacterium]|nr:alpha/beta fold hydrolase [Gemmatimonadaceae bacterium]